MRNKPPKTAYAIYNCTAEEISFDSWSVTLHHRNRKGRNAICHQALPCSGLFNVSKNLGSHENLCTTHGKEMENTASTWHSDWKQKQAIQHPSLFNGFLAYHQGRGLEIQNWKKLILTDLCTGQFRACLQIYKFYLFVYGLCIISKKYCWETGGQIRHHWGEY